MSYLKCKECGGRYDLQPGELPGQFERCNCGGRLEFYDNKGRKRAYIPLNKYKDKSKKTSPLMIVLIVLAVGYFLVMIGGSFVVGYMDAVNNVQPPGGLYTFFNGNYMIFSIIGLIFGITMAVICFFLSRNSSKKE